MRISTAFFLLAGVMAAIVALPHQDLLAGAIALLAFGLASREWNNH